MNDQVLNELRVVVERAVRPVRASDVRKLRMREELLDHLMGIYEEELERGGDEGAALARAKERFGTPSTLTGELQQSVSWFEYVGYVSDQYRFRPRESLLRFGLRHILVGFVTMTVATLVIIPLAWLGGRAHELGMLMHIMFVMVLFSSGFSFSVVVLAEKIGQLLYGQGAAIRAILPYCLASLLVFPVMTSVVYGSLLLSVEAALKGFLIGSIVAPAAPLLFYMMARQMKEQIAGEQQWLGIEIDQ